MFVILLSYVQPLNEVDKLIPAHREFLQAHYASGKFQLSGRLEPRTGGIIIATADSRAEVEMIIEQDPFYQARVAQYQVLEFLPGMAGAGLERFLQG